MIGALIATVVLLALIFAGMPVGYALVLVGLAGLISVIGMEAAFSSLPSTFVGSLGNYDLIAIPLFTLMGLVMFRAGVGASIFDVAHKWFGHIRGGLAIATVAGCAIFAAVSGSAIATAITLGAIAIPEMRRYGYSPALVGGTVAAAGTLGVLIPPSVTFIIYGILVNESIGDLFVAGIVPGIILAAAFGLMIYLRARRDPRLAPAVDPSSWSERFKSLLGLAPVLAIFIVVIGGLYLGFFTAVEAGAIGTIAAILVGIAQRKLRYGGFWQASKETTLSSVNILFIIAGAAVFGRYLTATRLPYDLAAAIGDWGAPAIVVLIVIALLYIVGGMFMEVLPLIIITVPIFAPVISAMGLDLVWFGVFIVLLGMIGMVTPPVGINLFAVKGIGTELTMSDVMRGSLPFVGVMCGITALWMVYGLLTIV